MCILCNLKKKTKWYYEDKRFIICDCETCKIPMVVSKEHIMPDLDDIGIFHVKLKILAVKVFGQKFSEFRKMQRRVKDHFHWHIILE